MQKNTTRKAFLMSLASMLLCLSMLVGSTFAWFTDTVTSGVNRIVAGNLDVEVEYTKDNGANWANLENSNDLFNVALWEPGYTEFVTLKIHNAGTLAFNYKTLVTPVSENGGINVNGDSFKLSDFLVFGTTPAASSLVVYDRDSARAAVGTTTRLNVNDLTKAGELDAGETEYITLVVYMPESVGNVANYKPGTTPPSIELGIKVIATQKTAETDSFGDDYDEDAVVAPEYLLGSYYNFFAQVNASAKAVSGTPTVITVSNIASLTVPADGAPNGADVNLVINKSAAPAGFSLEDDDKAVDHFDVDVTGTTAGTLVEVKWFVGKALTGVTVKHNNVAMTPGSNADQTYSYDPVTGYVTIWTASFSPFSIIYDKSEAALNGKLYGTLSSAYSAAVAGDTIYLLKNASISDTLIISKAITVDGNGYKVHPNTPSYFENIVSEQTAASSAKPLIRILSEGVVLKNITIEARAFSRHDLSIEGGVTATLDNVTLDHTDHSSRGNDSIQLNGGLIVKNKLTIKLGACLRYWDDKGNQPSNTGIVAKSWGGISFNDANCSITFAEGSSFNGINVYNESLQTYGQSQAMIHILSVDDFVKITGAENVGLVKVIGDSWSMTGYEVANSKFLKDNYKFIVNGVYYQSFNKAIEAANEGDTITLTGDMTINNYLNIAKKNITINGNGYSIKASDTNNLARWNNMLRFEGSEGLTFINVVFDGNGKEIGLVGSGKNMTYINCKFINAANAHYYGTSSGTLTFDGCTISTSVYGINQSEGGATVVIKNCNISGWNSFGSTETVTISDSTFGKGNSGYGVLRLYKDATLTNCTFSDDMELIDAGNTQAVVTITFIGCSENTADKVSNEDCPNAVFVIQ